MAIGYLITYEYDGKKGNDFSKIEPFQWLLHFRGKYPGIVMTTWQEANVPLGQIDSINELISIEKDLSEPEKDVEEVAEPKPETNDDELKQKRLDNLAKAREAKKKKAENGDTSK